MEWIVAESSSATTKPYVTRDTAVDRGIVRITSVLWTSETINAWGCSSTVEREIKPRHSAGCASLFRRESRFDSGHPHFLVTEQALHREPAGSIPARPDF